MPPRRPPGRSGRDIDGWWPPPSTPIAVEGGLQARSQRGRIGDTWWSQRFIAVLESFGIGSRLQRGKRYARAGQVLGMEISPGRITASVQGSRAKPYRVFIETNALTTAEWDAVEAVMASSAIFVAMLLADEMPEEIEEAFATSSVSLFPASANELDSACSCPDWENPCKHIAAVFFLLAEAFDRDPFFIFAWRGRSKEELLTSLRARRRGSDSSDGPNPDAVTEVPDAGRFGWPVADPGRIDAEQQENDWTDAVKAKNAEKLGDILADGWVGLGWDGKTPDKAKALADLKAPGNSLDSFEMGPMKVRIFGNTAVVTGSDTEKSAENGEDTSGKYIWTDVFVKQNGKWRAVASQSTKVPK